jgi:demethylmenaquinone methyltransferase/2-methoxy-6-polyprenyl-1,4-benzoquinol methylase
MSGTTPPGTANEQQASQWVQRMFAGIAPKYDVANHILSFNIDRRWRKRLLKRLAAVLAEPHARILDLCCGTGDVLLDFQVVSASAVIGADFCHPMLVAAQAKTRHRGYDAPLFEGDALRLPLRDNTLDAIAISFGFRNLANYDEGLRELRRVLKPGGTLAILEFSHPSGVLMKLSYGFYSSVLLPAIGTLVSGSAEAYRYLPDSIRKFPAAEELRRMMTSAGFEAAQYELLTGGVAAIHIGNR